MSGWIDQFADLHLLRPWWLLLVPIAILIWWQVRRRASVRATLPKGVAPHLAQALSIGATQKRKFMPIDAALLTVGLIALGASGPTWSRVPNLLLAQTSPLAVVLKVSKSMERRDVAPSRLERAKQKALDVVQARAGARTALIAYAGTAHRVVPLTQDPEILKPFLEGLTPEIMPKDGDNAGKALEAAARVLSDEPTPGAILFLVDEIDRADVPAFQTHIAAGGAEVIVLGVTKESTTLDVIDNIRGVTVIKLTPDRTDVAAIDRTAASVFRAALDADERLIWDDRGWILAWPAAIIILLWFRRGWTMRWGAMFVALAMLPSEQAHADGWRDWFLTPDQQGRLAYERKEFPEAADLFTDPVWKAHALHRAGRYEEAAELLTGLDTAAAAFAAGTAHMKSRGYREAIAAFETALERDPEHAAAQRNLEIAKAVLAYIEDIREQSDQGRDHLGADDVVFDNTDARGAEMQVEAAGATAVLTSEQWMQAVDTRVEDFLRSRFRLEEARRAE
ncbi:MAG: VWA domain-containing protein [Pseudomonadota bacterium]